MDIIPIILEMLMYKTVWLARLKFDYCILIWLPLLTYLMHSANTRSTDNMVQCKS